MAVESFKNISMSFTGTGLNAILDDVTIAKYATSLQGLTLQQANLALSTTELSAREKELILTKAGLIASTDALTAQEVLSTFQTEIGNKADAKQILIRSQLITEKQLEENATINLTWAEIQEAVAKGRLSVENAKILTSSLGVQGANYGEAVSFSVLTKAIGSTIKAIGTFLLTNPIGWAIITAGAIAGTVALIDAFTISLDEAKENLSNLKDECNSIESDLNSMNDELKTTADRMKELEDKDALTFIEKEEYDNLVKTNNELQRSIDLFELEQKIKNKEKNKAFVQTMDISANTNVSMMGTSTNVALKDYVQGQLEVYRTLIADGISEDEKEQAKYLENYFYDINKKWVDIAKDIQYIRNPETEDEKSVNEWLDFVNNFQDKMAIAMSGTNAKSNAFNRLVDNWQFDSAVQGLQDLGKEGKVTAEMLDDPKYDEFIQKLVEIGIIDSADNLDLIALAFNGVSGALDGTTTSTNNATTAVASLADTFKALKEALEDIIGYADTYQSAMSKIAAGTAMTADEVAKLLEIDPTLFDKFTKTKDGWQIDYSDLRGSFDENVANSIAEKVGGTKDRFQSNLEQGNKQLEELQEKRQNLLSGLSHVPTDVPDDVKNNQLKAIDEQIDAVKDKIQKAQEGLDLTDFYSDLFTFTDDEIVISTFDNVTDKIKDYNSEIKSLNDAIDTLNEGNSLSYDDMTELVNLYPQLENKVVKTADGYTIEKSALEDVRQQSYTTRNDYIDNQIEMLETTIETTRERIRLYYAEIGALNNYYEAKKAFEDTEADRQTIASIAELIKILESYKSEVLDPDNSSSSKDTISDKLQNQIDYYKMLLEAIGIVSDKVVEGLEKEKDAIDQKIDALNDEKDALQEKNDEQQRELDLIEAKNNLDKAKKQKVFVYKEGQGLVQVQDKKAVADAQKEYDDIQKEIKIANIDKQIDVYDKQKEAIEDQIDAQQKYGEQFTNMESDIQDTLIVEQAKKALGTDEKGLLSLDDKTINGIRDGLATAVYNKDVEDNKENSEYVTVKLEDFLKSVGATVTPTEFKAMASTITNNPANIIPATNSNSTVNNAQIINNKTANFNATFNIYDALDPYKIINTVKEYFNGVLKQTINSVK